MGRIRLIKWLINRIIVIRYGELKNIEQNDNRLFDIRFLQQFESASKTEKGKDNCTIKKLIL